MDVGRASSGLRGWAKAARMDLIDTINHLGGRLPSGQVTTPRSTITHNVVRPNQRQGLLVATNTFAASEAKQLGAQHTNTRLLPHLPPQGLLDALASLRPASREPQWTPSWLIKTS